MKLPKRFLEVLGQESSLAAETKSYLAKIETLVKSSGTTFFPEYTDHGLSHIENVLQNMERLIPEQLWIENSITPKLISSCILSGALHDFAMHLTGSTFGWLISKNRVGQLQSNHLGTGESDAKPLHEHWDEYLFELKQLPPMRLDAITGNSRYNPENLLNREAIWSLEDRFAIGEFVRRHHARIAHEIAIFGLEADDVVVLPGLDSLLRESGLSARLIGFIAHSHNLDLWECAQLLRNGPDRSYQPNGINAVFAMALLRIADYLEIDASRAPAVLMDFKAISSRVSRLEWSKHRVVESVSINKAEKVLQIDVSPDIEWNIFHDLKVLVESIQQELTGVTSVLSIVGVSDESSRGLSVNHLRSNILSVDFQASLPYVPKKSEISASSELVWLLSEQLYGAHTQIGVREAVQNAVDAVSAVPFERRQDRILGANALKVDVSFQTNADGSLSVEIVDTGTGMTEQTVLDYFLTCGGNYQNDDTFSAAHQINGVLSHVRTGRFGIGSMALFLLGDEILVSTRHFSQPSGLQFKLKKGVRSVEIRRGVRMEIGTSIRSEKTPEPNLWQKVFGHKPTPEDYVNPYRYQSSEVQVNYFIDGSPITFSDIAGSGHQVEIHHSTGLSIVMDASATDDFILNGFDICGPTGFHFPRVILHPYFFTPRLIVRDSMLAIGISLDRTSYELPRELSEAVFSAIEDSFISFLFAIELDSPFENSGAQRKYPWKAFSLWEVESENACFMFPGIHRSVSSLIKEHDAKCWESALCYSKSGYVLAERSLLKALRIESVTILFFIESLLEDSTDLTGLLKLCDGTWVLPVAVPELEDLSVAKLSALDQHSVIYFFIADKKWSKTNGSVPKGSFEALCFEVNVSIFDEHNLLAEAWFRCLGEKVMPYSGQSRDTNQFDFFTKGAGLKHLAYWRSLFHEW